MVSIKQSNPQKYYIRIICDVLFYFGLGNCSNEGRKLNKKQKYVYYTWAVISNFYVFSTVLNEILANIRTDLDEKEKSDLVQFTFAHMSISGKIIFTYLQKKRIIMVLGILLDNGTANFNFKDLNIKCVQKCRNSCLIVLGVTYFTIMASTVDGIRMHFAKGIPIRTEVTYYPPNTSHGIMVNILRFLIQFHWWYIVTIMLAVDCLCICSLVIVGHKFKVLQVYFNRLRESILEEVDTKSRVVLEAEYRERFVDGIKMHEHALWCAKNVQYALGNLYSVQIFESVTLLVMCLVKLVVNERDIIFLMANSAYICCLLILTGAYMMAAGDITYEASLVSTSMFHSGWDLVRPGKSLQVLIVFALQRSQVPVFMTAFGVMKLSYSRFIGVIRSSYSFFAVMY